MKKLSAYIDAYQQYHQKKATKLTHYIGIPLVMLGLFIGLQWVQLSFGAKYSVNLNVVLLIGALIFYAFLDIAFALTCLTALLIPFGLIVWLTPEAPTKASLIAFLVCFIGGWVLQFVGHAFEKKRPAFTDNLVQLLVAPLFLIVELMESKLAERYFPKLSSWLLMRIGKQHDAKF